MDNKHYIYSPCETAGSVIPEKSEWPAHDELKLWEGFANTTLQRNFIRNLQVEFDLLLSRLKIVEDALRVFIDAWENNISESDMDSKCNLACDAAKQALNFRGLIGGTNSVFII